MRSIATVSALAALAVLGASACEYDPATGSAPPPAAPAEPTVESRPELMDITHGSETFSAVCEGGRVVNYWPADAWDQAVHRCAEIAEHVNRIEDAIQN